ncbi:phosphoribosyltransferase [Hahella sp. KA22]|uniref:phosphoribosyltransferase n=1 Tax=Hahella sp. KA22 TaxID=1628392 RepID=UPI000FDDB852|nr:phosphoribosyltransferase [Hahella sp. KA22]AZZ94055.1 phosphoribosyltransferase [Hahella sp. KA22]QAY57429.1 phosphoribosyltransferase [Hahella sp. KA22]
MERNKKIIIKKVPDSGMFADLDSRLKKINCSGVECIVFKVSSEIIDHLKCDFKDRDQIVRRAGDGVPVYLLELNNEYKDYYIYLVQKEGCLKIDDKELLRKIRQADFIDVLERSDGECFHIADDGLHYQTPSGMHTKAFLRLADAVHSFGRMDRISYWMLTSINRADAVLFDNWSLASLVLHSQSILEKRIKFDCLHQHMNSNAEDAQKVAEGLLGKLEPSSTALVLVSVNASGGHLSSLLDMCKRIRPDISFQSASIYQMPCDKDTTPADITFCELSSQEMVSYEENSCPYCDHNDEVISIDERYYYPKQRKETPVSLPARYVDKNSDIRPSLDMLGSVEGALCVHRDDPNDEENPRHHAFYVDVTELAKNDAFISIFTERMNLIEEEYGIPDVIVCPPHSAAKSMLNIISQRWKIKAIVTHNLLNISEEEENILKSSKHICILDDVIITGSRIDRYVRAMRERLSLNTNIFKSLSIFIAVLRGENESCVKKLKDGALSRRNGWASGLYSVAEIYLPNWGEKECPWCKEANIWGEVPPPFDEPDYYRSRMTALNSSFSSGIVDNPIIKIDPSYQVTLGSSSPLADAGANEMHVLFVVAVALQRMRSDPEGKNRLVRTLVNNNALDVTNNSLPCGKETNVFKRYSEPLIQACLLRCAKPSEWSSDILKHGIPFLISNLKDNVSKKILLLEIILYLKRRTYCSAAAQDLEKAYEPFALGSDDPVLALLKTMIK